LLERKTVLGRGKYGKIMGFSEATRVGKFVYVAGHNAHNENGEITTIDSYEQTVIAIKNVERALREAGSSLQDVVKTRVYVGPSTDWRAVQKAHREFFGKVKPCSTFLFTNFFSDPRLMVEVEAEALVE